MQRIHREKNASGVRTDLGDLVMGKTMQGLKDHIKELLNTWGSPWSSLEQKSHMLQYLFLMIFPETGVDSKGESRRGSLC